MTAIKLPVNDRLMITMVGFWRAESDKTLHNSQIVTKAVRSNHHVLLVALGIKSEEKDKI